MKKRLKVFQAGVYPQGEFSAERVNTIFSGLDKVVGIYAHSSKWAEKNEKPLDIAEFSNFIIDNGVVTAECEFNEKGIGYYNDKVLRGVSVEIVGDKLNKIALLPIGVKPAVEGAEFEEDTALIEFEEIEEIEEPKEPKVETIEMLLEKIKEMNLDDRSLVLKAVLDSLTNEEKERIQKLYWADFEKKEEEKLKTEQEIRAEIIAEFERKEKAKNLKAIMKTKVVPCIQPFVEFAIDKALESNVTLEFEENGIKTSITEFEKLRKDIEALPNAVNFESKTEKWEFSSTDEEDVMKESYEATRKVLGGK